jgi:chemotaxis protein MotB
MAARNKANRHGVVIKKEEVVEGGHHGGAWKVAYADFVTAMMTFFLLMWLINATTEAQRKGLADYFSPLNSMARAPSGSGAPFGGQTPFAEGTLVSNQGQATVLPGRLPAPPDQPADAELSRTAGESDPADSSNRRSNDPVQSQGNAKTQVDADGEKAPGGGVAATQAPTPSRSEFLANAGAGTLPRPDPAALDTGALRAELAKRERAELAQTARQIREAVAADPELAAVARQLAIDVTAEGLRIQVLDDDHQPMFASGAAAPNERARAVLRKIAPALSKLPQPLEMTGHTDASQYKGTERSNWDLSSERANATRRLLTEWGLPEGRYRSVSGRADHELLLPADPLAAPNRRITILLLSTVPLGPAPAKPQ